MSKGRIRSWRARARDIVASSKWGLGGALLANLCCAPAAISIALGLGGSAFLVGLAQYKLYFALMGLAAMGPAGWRLLRPIGSCSARERRGRLSRFAFVIVAFVGGYLAISYLLLPWLYTLG
ncbi:MAG: hypothetical protein M3R38_05500 [Actinomycetota bacterium]|nr:hypothetical protein [Actinomycetota bacterium]MDP9475137.1 hypothetical protein [Actinomycetota bacterium]